MTATEPHCIQISIVFRTGAVLLFFNFMPAVEPLIETVDRRDEVKATWCD